MYVGHLVGYVSVATHGPSEDREQVVDRSGKAKRSRGRKSTKPDAQADRRYEVFISSTFVDLQDEREKVIQAVLKLDCFPAGMELFPASDASQRKVIRRVIDRCDYYVVIVAGRYGSRGEDNLSYTEEEFDYAVSKGIPVLAFVHGNPDSIPVGKTDQNDDARRRLEAFRDKVSTGRHRNEWVNPDDLAAKVALALVNEIKTNPRRGWVRGPVRSVRGPARSVRGPVRRGERKQAKEATVVEPQKPPPASKAALREYLQQGDYRFEELISDALRRGTDAAGSISAAAQIPPEEYRALVKQCEEASADLVEIAGETAYFGKEAQHDVLLAAVEQLCNFEPRGGFVYLNQLRFCPAVLTFYAAGVAAVAKGNYDLLRKFHALPLVDQAHGRAPALRILSPSYALQGPFQVPRPDGQVLKTPQSDRIMEVIRAPLLRLPMMNIKNRYEDLFSRFEYINAIAAALAEGVYPYYGRFTWYGGPGRFTENALAEAVAREVKEQGKEWSPFKAGLFRQDLDAFMAAKAQVDREVQGINIQFG